MTLLPSCTQNLALGYLIPGLTLIRSYYYKYRL